MGKQVPLWYALLCLALAVSSIAFTFAEVLARYRVSKPIVLEVAPMPPSLKIVSFSFIYSTSENVYTSLVLELENTGDKTLTCKVNVSIFDANYREIANGTTLSGVVNPKSKLSVTVAINWLPGTSVLDFTAARVTIQETVPEEAV